MTVYRNEGRYDTSNVEFGRGQNFINYDKKNRTLRMTYIDYGLGLFRKELFDLLAIFSRSSISPMSTGDALGRGELAGFEVEERFYEIGTHGRAG